MQTAEGAGAWHREPGTVVRPSVSLPPGAPESPVIFAETEIAVRPLEWTPHTHPRPELVWVHGGSMTARIDGRIFTVSDGFGLWIPAGVEHSGRVTAHAQLSNAFFATDRNLVFDGPTVVAMTPLLEALLVHLASAELDADARTRAEAVVFDVLEPSPHPLTLQLPGDARVDDIAAALLENPADDRTLADWAVTLGTSERTVSRAFRSATGLSFLQWRRALRVHAALRLLAEGHDVAATSEQLGYGNASTFIAAFRRVMGTTPGARVRPASVSGTRHPLS